MSKALDELEYMMVVCENPPQSFLDSKEHYREVLNEALIEVVTYMRDNNQDIKEITKGYKFNGLFYERKNSKYIFIVNKQ